MMVIDLDIAFKNENIDYYVKSDGIIYFLGPNQSGKSLIINLLKDGFSGKQKDFLVNNMKVDKNDYNVIYFDDTTDFNSEFKFTKTNVFRELIYTSVLNNINETKLLKEVNDLFDKVDVKVNQFLEINVNKKQDEKMNFDIEINDVNEIIDKFTNIYVDNYLIKDVNLPRSIKRKLIYNLLLLELKKSKDKDNVVFIDNFDLYLDYENTKKIITKLNEYRKNNPNTYFFLSSGNNIFELIKDKKSVYHTQNKVLSHIDNLADIIQECLLKVYYDESDKKISFEKFYEENSELFKDDIDLKVKEVMCLCQFEIGKIFVSNKVRLIKQYESKYDDIIIYCKDRFYQYFYEKLYDKLNGID